MLVASMSLVGTDLPISATSAKQSHKMQTFQERMWLRSSSGKLSFPLRQGLLNSCVGFDAVFSVNISSKKCAFELSQLCPCELWWITMMRCGDPQLQAMALTSESVGEAIGLNSSRSRRKGSGTTRPGTDERVLVMGRFLGWCWHLLSIGICMNLCWMIYKQQAWLILVKTGIALNIRDVLPIFVILGRLFQNAKPCSIISDSRILRYHDGLFGYVAFRGLECSQDFRNFAVFPSQHFTLQIRTSFGRRASSAALFFLPPKLGLNINNHFCWWLSPIINGVLSPKMMGFLRFE